MSTLKDRLTVPDAIDFVVDALADLLLVTDGDVARLREDMDTLIWSATRHYEAEKAGTE
jgi:hypothetical protein